MILAITPSINNFIQYNGKKDVSDAGAEIIVGVALIVGTTQISFIVVLFLR